MIALRACSEAAEVRDLSAASFASLSAPMDGMWEAFAAGARHWEISVGGERAGFCCANEAGQLLRFHLGPEHEGRGPEAFAQAVSAEKLSGAVVSTADPLFCSLCLDRQRRLRVHTYLYRVPPGAASPDLALPEALREAGEPAFEPVARQELLAVEAFVRASFEEDPGDWLPGYLENLVAREEIYALRAGPGTEILGTGELRVSETQPPFADLGVITSRAHRGRGLAPYVLSRLRTLCAARGLEPICSTTVENAAAQRAIAKAGFTSRHRMLEVWF